jgi:hypothetical protein
VLPTNSSPEASEVGLLNYREKGAADLSKLETLPMASSPKALEDEMIPIPDETQFYDQTFQSSSNNLLYRIRKLAT